MIVQDRPTKKWISVLAGFGAVFLLSACSGGEPSESDIQAVIKAGYDKSAESARTMSGGVLPDGMLPQFFGAKKIGCAAAQGSAGYNCDIEIDASKPIIGRSQEMVKLRFVKSDNGWVIVQ